MMATKLSDKQIELIKKMGNERVNSDAFSSDDAATLGELIALEIVEKVRGQKGWSAWQVVNFYDLMNEIESPAKEETAIPAESTGPTLTEKERATIESPHNENFDYLRMTPIDPRDARIAALEAEVVTLRERLARLEERNNDLFVDRAIFHQAFDQSEMAHEAAKAYIARLESKVNGKARYQGVILIGDDGRVFIRSVDFEYYIRLYMPDITWEDFQVGQTVEFEIVVTDSRFVRASNVSLIEDNDPFEDARASYGNDILGSR